MQFLVRIDYAKNPAIQKQTQAKSLRFLNCRI
jgi:hypothetical protein